MNHKLTILLLACLGVLATLSALHFSPSLTSKETATAVGVAPAKQTVVAKSKPVCSQVIVPAGDCIPQHLANMPPDPGPEGNKTLLGVITNPEGVRDDVYRYIVQNYGHSERAVRALMQVAKQYQHEIEKGDSVTPDEVQAYTQKVTTKVMGCYIRSVAENIINDRAHERVGVEVTNTPERYRQAKKFNSLLHGRVIDMDTSPVAEQCGYDPAALPN